MTDQINMAAGRHL